MGAEDRSTSDDAWWPKSDVWSGDDARHSIDGMSRRNVAATVVLVSALSFATAAAAQATRHVLPVVGHPGSAAARPVHSGGSCFEQLTGSAGNTVPSEKFTESELAAYTSRSVDDFALATPCVVRSVDIFGFYGATGGPADSEQIVVYEDNAGRPGKVIVRQNTVGTDDVGSFHLMMKRPLALKPGMYWMSARVNISFYEGGRWGWMVTRDLQGSGALWRNPLDGYGTGCTRFTAMPTCVGDPGGPDFMFSVNHTR